MAILITGGTGFIGSELVRLLIEREDERLVLFDLYPQPDNISDFASAASVVRGDFSEPTELTRVLRQHDVTDVFHLAYYTSEAESFPAQAIRVNCTGTNALFECAQAHGVRRVVWPSSAAVYATGTTSANPTWKSEGDPVTPTSIYGACKLFNEHVAEVYAERRGFDHVALRLCSVFGPGRGRRRGIPPDLYAALLDDPLQGRAVETPPSDHVLTWGYVTDAAEAFYAAYKAASPPRRIYNFAGPSSTVDEAAAIVQHLCPDAQITAARTGMRHLAYVRGDLLADELGFRPTYGVRDGITDCLDRMRGQRP